MSFFSSLSGRRPLGIKDISCRLLHFVVRDVKRFTVLKVKDVKRFTVTFVSVAPC